MRAMITGVSMGGFGGALALRLAEDARRRDEKLRLVLCATGRKPGLTEVLAKVREMGADARAATGDLSDPQTPARLIDEALDHCGGLDALASNAGVYGPNKPWIEIDVAHFDRFFAINLRAAWLLSKAAHPALKESKGSIVLTASLASLMPFATAGVYCASKAGVAMLCEQLAQEFAPDGIRVNAVSPGIVHTPLNDDVLGNQEAQAQRRRIIPLGRMGRIEEVAGTLAFLFSADAGFMTGQNILVDGGFAQSSAKGERDRRE